MCVCARSGESNKCESPWVLPPSAAASRPADGVRLQDSVSTLPGTRTYNPAPAHRRAHAMQVIVFHGETISAWRKQGYHEDAEHTNRLKRPSFRGGRFLSTSSTGRSRWPQVAPLTPEILLPLGLLPVTPVLS